MPQHEISRQLIAAIVSFSKNYNRLFRRLSVEQGRLGFRSAEARILELLTSGSLTQSEMKSALVMSSAQLSRALRALSDKELAAPQHYDARRHSKWMIREAGLALVAQSASNLQTATGTALQAMGEVELEEFIDNAKNIVEAATDSKPRDSTELIRTARPREQGKVISAVIADGFWRYFGFDDSIENYIVRAFADHAFRDAEEKFQLVFDSHGGVVGTALVEIDGGVGTLSLVWVMALYAGVERGKDMVQEAVHRCSDAGCKTIQAWILHNPDGRNFFEKIGWQLSETVERSIASKQVKLERWTLPAAITSS